MPTIHRDVEQGSLEWLQLHVGRPTASEFGQIMTPEFAKKKGEIPKTYLAKKLAEAFSGAPLPGFSGSWVTDQGHLREDEARPWYELEHDVTIEQVGFVESDDGRCGCSPDGLIGDDEGIEIKGPEVHTHVKYLINDEIPDQYVTQVHGSLFVTGRKRWHFLSYRRGFPALVKVVERDEAIMRKIESILSDFYAEFDKAMQALKAKAA